MNLAEIDKNFAMAESFGRKDIKGYNILNAPFSIHGLLLPVDENDGFHRMPQEIADKVSVRVADLHTRSAGGRVRFKTDSAFIGIHPILTNCSRSAHVPFTCSSGFDLYVKDQDGKQTYCHTFAPPIDPKADFIGQKELSGGIMREYTINFPLYSTTKSLEIYLEEGAHIEAPDPYTYQTPIVYYGSSITQGACASRPGTCYENIISRRFDCDYINLGFTGHAKGEPAMADYIATLDMSIFVYDYDYNAPSDEHYEKTHESMFRVIRAAHPDLPVIFLNRPNLYLHPEAKVRQEITKRTYQNAVDSGDKNVYFIDSCDFFDGGLDDCMFVDGTHPNDIGFWAMAKRIGDEIEKLLIK